MIFIGLVVGSFLNVAIYRLPIMMVQRTRGRSAETAITEKAVMSLSQPASHCPACGHAIRWYENIPVLSWCALRGRCSKCSTPISARYVLIEAGTGALFGLLAWRMGSHLAALATACCCAAALAAAAIARDRAARLKR